MSANTLTISPELSECTYPLRGDMDVTLNFIPDDPAFCIRLYTYDANTFVLKSTQAQFRQLDNTLANTFSFGGKESLWVKIMYNSKIGAWTITSSNLVSGDTSSGSGITTGPTATTGNRPEVLLTPVNGIITPDGAVSNRFRFKLEADTKIGNPINFFNNEHIYLTGYQDIVGNHKMSFGLGYLLLGAQAYVPPQAANAAFIVELRPTLNLNNNSLNWVFLGSPDKTVPAGYSLVTEIVFIDSTGYYTMGTGLSALMNGQIAKVVRNGLSNESTGTKIGTLGETYRLYGVPVPSNGVDQRPVLKLLQVDFSSGGANRPAYGKALINLEGKGTTYIRDLRVTGARNDGSDARGICHNDSGMNLILNNVEISDCNNGILTGNASTAGNTEMYDAVIDRCGIGGPAPDDPTHGYTTVGFTHSVYFGHNPSTVRMARVSLTNAVQGDNLKCRSAVLYATQLLCSGAGEGRELEIPNGGWVEIDNSTFWKQSQVGTGNMIMLGGNGGAVNTAEGLDTSRPRKYKFTNCLFRSDYILNGRDAMLICILDPDVSLELIDCKFEGPAASNNSDDPNARSIYDGTTTVNGIRYKTGRPPIITYTGGPVGPLPEKPPGAVILPMTPV